MEPRHPSSPGRGSERTCRDRLATRSDARLLRSGENKEPVAKTTSTLLLARCDKADHQNQTLASACGVNGLKAVCRA